ncbi:MAG: hypothetical protein NT062_36585 [Proteobacteria bacterium]|nr:hypothetical protein [Pseudomonadota bacterium]
MARGTLHAVRRGKAHEFVVADLDALREARAGMQVVDDHDKDTSSATISTDEATSTMAIDTVNLDHSSIIEDETRELAAAAARERALTSKLTAEVERLRAERARDELVRAHRGEDRARRIDEIIERTTSTLDGAARDYLSRLLGQRLLNADLDSRLSVAGLIAHAKADTHQHMANLLQIAAERAANVRAQVSRQGWRTRRINAVIADLMAELEAGGAARHVVEHAAVNAGNEISQLDDGTLAGDWALQVARSATVLGVGSCDDHARDPQSARSLEPSFLRVPG